MPKKVQMDAADGSYYKRIIQRYAKDNHVKVKQISNDLYELSWKGLSYNDIMDREEEK